MARFCLPPPVPDADWLTEFAMWLRRLAPAVTPEAAASHALLAHDCTWLLDPPEAADLWLRAVEALTADPPR